MSNRVRKDKDSHRKLWAVLFVIISLFCIIFFAARGRFQAPVSSKAALLVLSPFQQAVSWVGSQVIHVTGCIWEIVPVHEQMKQNASKAIGSVSINKIPSRMRVNAF